MADETKMTSIQRKTDGHISVFYLYLTSFMILSLALPRPPLWLMCHCAQHNVRPSSSWQSFLGAAISAPWPLEQSTLMETRSVMADAERVEAAGGWLNAALIIRLPLRFLKNSLRTNQWFQIQSLGKWNKMWSLSAHWRPVRSGNLGIISPTVRKRRYLGAVLTACEHEHPWCLPFQVTILTKEGANASRLNGTF